MKERPLAIDLFTGLHGWSDGLIAEGFRVVGFDLEDMSAQFGQPKPEHFQLVVQDVLTLHGSQFKDAAVIVASPPCQEYSWMAMPWSRARQVAAALRGEAEFPEGYRGSRTKAELTALFDACLRIQREASAAAGRRVPLVIENVRGAQPWVGRAAWSHGSFFLWGDVPALMPIVLRSPKVAGHSMTKGAPKWNMHHPECVEFASFNNPDGLKQPGISGPRNNGKGDRWFQDGAAAHGSKSSARKMASAMIAKIPLELARHIGRCWHPQSEGR